MYLKLIGGMMVIGSTTIAGRILASGYSNRPKDLNILQGALQTLETEIIYGSTPLPEAIMLVGQRVNGKVGNIFNAISRILKADNCLTVKEAWEIGINETWEDTALLKSDTEILLSLGKNIGISDRKDQEKHLKLAREIIKQQLVKAEDLAVKNVRMWNYLGFSSGLVLVLLVL